MLLTKIITTAEGKYNTINSVCSVFTFSLFGGIAYAPDSFKLVY